MTKESSRDAHMYTKQDGNVGTKIMFETASLLSIDRSLQKISEQILRN